MLTTLSRRERQNICDLHIRTERESSSRRRVEGGGSGNKQLIAPSNQTLRIHSGVHTMSKYSFEFPSLLTAGA